MESEEKLLELKRKLLKNKVNHAILFELKELNNRIDRMSNKETNTNVIAPNLKDFKFPEKVEVSNLKDFPKELKISNINDIKLPSEIEIKNLETINYDLIKSIMTGLSVKVSNPEKVDVLNPIKWLYNGMEKLMQGITKAITSRFEKPTEEIISRDEAGRISQITYIFKDRTEVETINRNKDGSITKVRNDNK